MTKPTARYLNIVAYETQHTANAVVQGVPYSRNPVGTARAILGALCEIALERVDQNPTPVNREVSETLHHALDALWRRPLDS